MYTHCAQLFFAMSQTPEHTAAPQDWLHVESLGLDARGVARRAGKVIFIEGALPGEQVSACTTRRKQAWEAATVTAIHRESTLRVAPRCPHFGLHQGACGGCPHATMTLKQGIERILRETIDPEIVVERAI